MSSSPPGSLSDTASKAMSSPVASPVTPSNGVYHYQPPFNILVHELPCQVITMETNVISESSNCNLSNCKEGSQLQSPPVLEIPGKLPLLCCYLLPESMNCREAVFHSIPFDFRDCKRVHSGSLNGNKCYILLLGNTGMGKTTLIRKLCLDWSRGCIPQFDFVFLLDGKALTLKEPNHSLQTLLLNSSSFAPSCMDPEAVYTQILAASKRVLIIFDGFDEVRDYETLLQTQEKDLMTSLQKDTNGQIYTIRQLYSAILQRVLLPGCTLLLSTRPRGTANQLLRRTDSLVEMYGFNPKDVETYLSRYFTDPALRESALDYLKKSSFLHLLCWNPGLCRLACLVLEQAKSLAELPRTLTGLCHQVLCQKLERDNGITHLKTELSSLAWEGVKANSSILPAGRTISDKLRALGHRTGLTCLNSSRQSLSFSFNVLHFLFLFVFLSFSFTRTVTDRIFQQNLPFQSGPKWRRRSHREELELAQRFTVGLLFNNRTELQRLHSYTDTASRDIVNSKQALLRTHLESLSHDDLSPAQVLEACHHVYEASFTCIAHLAVNLPEVVTFHGVPLNPSDVFTVQNVLDRGRSEGRSFSLDLEDSVLQLSGLRALVALNNINTYRASIADVITLWEELEQSGEEELLQGSVSKFKIHPLRATQVCHIEHLAKLVNIHMQKKLLSQNCIGDQGVTKLLPTLRDLPKLHCLSLYSNVISDKGAESLAVILPHMRSLIELDVKYNKLTDVGAQSLGASLRNCKKMKTLR
uniref:Class II, major histocompatibility complex, transactivator n=1 Tax=Labrus bergylta TaxID=56723 RepID=A0A3Q3NAK4_9LABR